MSEPESNPQKVETPITEKYKELANRQVSMRLEPWLVFILDKYMEAHNQTRTDALHNYIKELQVEARRIRDREEKRELFIKQNHIPIDTGDHAAPDDTIHSCNLSKNQVYVE